MIKFPFVNVATGEPGIPAYVDATEIIAWYQWKVGDDLGPGVSRKLRGQTLVVLVTKAGSQHWTDASFASVSARILEARALSGAEQIQRLKNAAEIHAAEHAAELSTKKSPLAV